MPAPAAEPRRRRPARRPARGLSLGEYVVRRNGVPAGARGGLRNMLHRSLGAPTFAGFWRHWNPVFGYLLGRFVYAPLRRVLPRTLAFVATFVACGALHDLVTVAARGGPAFLFTPWFLFLGLGAAIGRAAGLDLSRRAWGVRAAANLGYVAASLGLALGALRLAA